MIDPLVRWSGVRRPAPCLQCGLVGRVSWLVCRWLKIRCDRSVVITTSMLTSCLFSISTFRRLCNIWVPWISHGTARMEDLRCVISLTLQAQDWTSISERSIGQRSTLYELCYLAMYGSDTFTSITSSKLFILVYYFKRMNSNCIPFFVQAPFD